MRAAVAELADATALGAVSRKGVEVRVLSAAPIPQRSYAHFDPSFNPYSCQTHANHQTLKRQQKHIFHRNWDWCSLSGSSPLYHTNLHLNISITPVEAAFSLLPSSRHCLLLAPSNNLHNNDANCFCLHTETWPMHDHSVPEILNLYNPEKPLEKACTIPAPW